MFRATKKIKKPRVFLSNYDDDDDDDDDDEVEQTIIRPVKKPTNRAPARSFDVEVVKESVKKRKRKEFGFGGSIPRQEDKIESHDWDNGYGESNYDKDAIDKLKTEQKYREVEEDMSTDINNPFKDLTTERYEPTNDPLPSFIPLNNRGDEVFILTGDEALNYNDVTFQNKLQKRVEIVTQEDALEGREGEVTRQAYEKPQKKSEIAFETTTIAELKAQIKLTVSHLKFQQKDLQQVYMRRQVEKNHIKEELERQESDLESAGVALEYYQELRLDLSSWVGAMRDLKKKVAPLHEALRLLDKEFLDCRICFEDDAIHVLRETGLLEQVLGRQPTIPLDTATVTDEFGRSTKSQDIMAREKRTRYRQQMRKERHLNGDESDALISESGKDELKERRRALQKALHVAMNEVDDHFTSLVNLIVLFSKWFTSYREEYIQCFAGISLAELSSVLIQVDLCSIHHPLHWQGDGFPWIKALQDISTFEINIEGSPLYRIVDKVLIPAVEDILHDQAYSLISSRHTRSLATFFFETSKVLPKGSILIDKLSSQLSHYIESGLQSMAIPILKSGLRPPVSDDICDAFNYATTWQICCIEKIITNLMTYWAPELGDKLAKPILDFTSSQLLFLLSSLNMRDASGRLFGKVYNSLLEYNWLQRPEFMFQATVIQAAAVSYRDLL